MLQLKLSKPNPDDLGHVDSVSVEEIGGARVHKYFVDQETIAIAI